MGIQSKRAKRAPLVISALKAALAANRAPMKQVAIEAISVKYKAKLCIIAEGF